jgi:uncharacterized protein (TIGR02118 family)
MVTVLALYPNTPGSHFDVDYYRTRHAPLALDLLIPHGLNGLRLSEGVSGMDGAPPPYWMASEMRFPSRDAFARAMEACGDALFADAAHYTDSQPILQFVADGVELASSAFVETRSNA